MKLFFLISFIFSYFIFCEEKNETKSDNINKNNTQELNLTIEEMDKMMLCSIFIQEALRKDKDRIEALANKTNIVNSYVFEKIGTDIFENCYNNINLLLVRKYFKNLTYLGGYEWRNEFDKFIEIDYDKYLEKKDFNLTLQQKILSHNFDIVKEKFKQKQLEEREKVEEEKNKLKIGNFDLENIPNNLKGAIFLLIFAIIFGGSIYILKILINKPKKKKERKKKTQ